MGNLGNGVRNLFFSVVANEGENRYHSAYYDNNDFKLDNKRYENFNNHVSLMCNEIEENSVVMDFGCGSGPIGKAVTAKKCTAYAIEMDKMAAQYVLERGYYKDVFVFDLNNPQGEEYDRYCAADLNVDYVVLSNILEHVQNPTVVLRATLRELKSGGNVLISIPNVSYADIYLHLMNGTFNYDDIGILDNTHLKFFTKSSFFQWIDLINETYDDVCLDCEHFGATFRNNDYLEMIKAEHRELFDIIETNPQFNVIENLFKLTKLKPDESAKHLEAGLAEKQVDVVGHLSDTLKRIKGKEPKATMLIRSERLWFESLVNAKEENIANLQALVNAKEVLITKQNQYLEQKNELITKRNQYLAEKNEHITNLRLEVEKRDEHITNQKLGLEQNDEQIKALKQSVEKKNEQIKILKQSMEKKNEQIKILKQKMEQKNKKIQGMEHSRSWKLTKPLRAVTSLLKK